MSVPVPSAVRLTRLTRRAVVGLLLLCAGAGCTGAGGAANGSAAGRLRLELWHTRRDEQEAALRRIAEEYSRENPGVEIVPVFQSGYNDLLQKARAAVQAKRLPAMTMAYEAHVTEYMRSGVVRPLDDLIADPEIGFSESELSDIPEPYLQSNRYPEFEGKLLSFPFTKSTLVLYYNQELLEKAGFSRPPVTWEELERQAAAISRQLGAPAYGFTADASTLDGMLFSRGGHPLTEDGQRTRFDEPPMVETLAMLQRMRQAGTLLEAPADDVGSLFLAQRCAFATETSSMRSFMEEQVGDRFRWDVALLPHAQAAEPATVMYGPNVCLFRGSPEQEREAWKFVKYFVSPPVTARWARETGYLPIRRSAVELPEMREFYRDNPRALTIWHTLPVARPEPNVIGWQEVRSLLEDSARAVVSGKMEPRAAALELKRKSDQALAASR
ncbi:MAG: ABC transporter substrate-binding protein [Armatimonadota bacterium]